MATGLRYNFIAHEPGLGHLAGRHFASGGAGFCVAEQTLAINFFLSARQLDARRVSVLCPTPPDKAKPAPELPVVCFDAPNSNLDEAIDTLTAQCQLELFDRLIPANEVLTAHHIPAAIVASRLGRPFLFFMHSLWPGVMGRLSSGLPSSRSIYCQEIADKASAIFVPTQIEKELLLSTAQTSLGVDSLDGRVHVLPVGLNPYLAGLARGNNIPNLRKEWRRRLLPDADPDDLVFYTVGRFVPYKKQLGALRAFLTIAADLPKTHLLMVGPATDTAYVERLRQTLLMAPNAIQARVTIRGAEPIEAAHLAGDVLVHAAAFESWGRVIDEACLFGNPTVLNAFPTIAEKAGFRCTPAPTDCTDDSAATATDLRFIYSPVGDQRKLRSLLIDCAQQRSIETALYEAGTNASWRDACSDFNRRSVEARGWLNIVPTIVSLWNAVEWEITGKPAFFE